MILASDQDFEIDIDALNSRFFKDDELKSKLNFLSIYNPADILERILLTSKEIDELLEQETKISSLTNKINTNNNSLLEFHTAENFHNFSKTIKTNLIKLAEYSNLQSILNLLKTNSDQRFESI